MIQQMHRPSVMVAWSTLAEVDGLVNRILISHHLARHDQQAAAATAGLARDDHREVTRAEMTAKGFNKVGDQGLL